MYKDKDEIDAHEEKKNISRFDVAQHRQNVYNSPQKDAFWCTYISRIDLVTAYAWYIAEYMLGSL